MLDFSVTFLITIINITILYVILRKVLFKPVTKFMADRANNVQASIEQAEKDRASAKNLLADYNKKLENAEAEAEEIIKAARENANKEAKQIVEEGKAEAASMLDIARKHIESEHQASLAKFKLEAAAIVIAASSKLASRDISGDDNWRYANMLLEELSAQKGKI